MSVTITCTAKSGTTINAQATADSAVTWELDVTPSGGGPAQPSAAIDVVQSGIHTATWTKVADGTYLVKASTRDFSSDSQSVPFGTCS
jgi:alkyl hydroperoxide reductase subunit AhpF